MDYEIRYSTCINTGKSNIYFFTSWYYKASVVIYLESTANWIQCSHEEFIAQPIFLFTYT